MIKTFKCKETEKLFNGRFSAKLPQAIQRAAVIKLKMVHAASIFDTSRIPPSNHLEVLHHVTGRGSTASGSTNNGAYASFGKAMTPLMLKSLIIIREVTL